MSVPAKVLISLAIALHAGVLVLNNLDWCPLVERLYPYYSWYPRGTGQVQGWAMYRYPLHRDLRFQLVATFADGSTRCLTSTFTMDDRELYFHEWCFEAKDGEAQELAYLDRLHRTWKERPVPTELSVVRFVRPIPEMTAGGAPPATAPFAVSGLFRKKRS